MDKDGGGFACVCTPASFHLKTDNLPQKWYSSPPPFLWETKSKENPKLAMKKKSIIKSFSWTIAIAFKHSQHCLTRSFAATLHSL